MSWLVSDEPQAELSQWSSEGMHLFAQPAWAHVLASLGCRARYVWHAERAWGAMVPVFARMGVRVGFLGFPICDPHCPVESTATLQPLARACDVHVLRVVSPMRLARIGALPATAELPDAWISDLARWPGELEKRTRRHLAQAAKRCQDMLLVSGVEYAGAAHALYAATLARHRGTLRYHEAYFRALFSLAGAHPAVSALCALRGDSLCAFVVAARDGDTVYYLHGALAPEARETYVFDLLMRRQIEWAQQSGATRFDFRQRQRVHVAHAAARSRAHAGRGPSAPRGSSRRRTPRPRSDSP